MKLHVVGGFLGSGKTTAISQAAKRLLLDGYRVGVVTNDQGKYLVDTAFFALSQVPAVEVTGGCFCCNYDDLNNRLDQLEQSEQPDIVFAESVGSCADLVATVLKPLLTLQQTPSSLSIFADSRLLLRRLRGETLPFAEDVIYIFDKQIEEAGILVINKVDLLTAGEVEQVIGLAQAQYPAKEIKLQDSRDADSVKGWLSLLHTGHAQPDALEIDYDRYGAGEAQLAWFDAEIVFGYASGMAAHIGQVVQAVVTAIQGESAPIGHLKFVVRDETGGCKISLTAAADEDWRLQLPAHITGDVTLLVNARVALGADRLAGLVRQAVTTAAAQHGLTYTFTHADQFHPTYPRPTHRLHD